MKLNSKVDVLFKIFKSFYKNAYIFELSRDFYVSNLFNVIDLLIRFIHSNASALNSTNAQVNKFLKKS